MKRDKLWGMVIRQTGKDDVAAVRAIHKSLYPDEQLYLDGRSWVILVGDEVVGYTAVSAVPGLTEVYALRGGIMPTYQRQGLGSRLLQHILYEGSRLGIRQLSHCVTDLNSPAAHFLRRHQFFHEHEEWLMRLPNLQTRQLANSPLATCHLQTRRSPTRLFRTLYDRSFDGTPWYQPYSQEEVENTLEDPADILFLFKDEEPIGFAWLHGEAQEAAIEPIGIVQEEWGQGYGRFLLLAALHKLKQRGARQAQIGVWRDNQAAVHLYQSVGFRHQQTLTYLAFQLAVCRRSQILQTKIILV